jgi:hypothetical protein
MGKGGFIDGQISPYVLFKNKSFAGSFPVFPILVFTQFITVIPLKLFAANAVERAYRLKAVRLSIG